MNQSPQDNYVSSYANQMSLQNLMSTPQNQQQWQFQHLNPQYAGQNNHWNDQHAGTQNGQAQAGNMHLGPNQHNHFSALSTLPLITPQLVQDVLRMSEPVGSSPNDEAIMVQILYESPMTGQTYKQALESLHGINNHAASLWKDYYLDHRSRIDHLVLARAEQNGIVAKAMQNPQPSAHAPSVDSSHTRPSSSVPRHSKSRKSSKREDSKASSSSNIRPAKRATINSITTHAPVQSLPNLLPPQTDIVVPPPPSRSPTPPTEVIPGPRGNKYTQADRDYFIKFISWRLKGSPDLSKAELCTLLAEKVPHHTSISWASHWHARHELADKILAVAQGPLSPEDSHSESSAPGAPPFARRPRYDVDRSSASCSDSESADDESVSDVGDKRSQFEDVDTEEDVASMGGSGSPFTGADARVMARYIASLPDWATLGYKGRWVPFEEMFPQRSGKAWAEHYRKERKVLDKMARRYAKRKHTARLSKPSISSQRGRPTWAKSHSRADAPMRRKLVLDDAEAANGDKKRGKRKRERSRSFETDDEGDEGSDADADGEEVD